MQTTEERLFGLHPESTVYRSYHFQELVEVILVQSNQMLPRRRCHLTSSSKSSQSDRKVLGGIPMARL